MYDDVYIFDIPSVRFSELTPPGPSRKSLGPGVVRFAKSNGKTCQIMS